MSDRPAQPPRRGTRRIINRGAIKRLLVLFAAIVGLLVWAYFAMLSMPGVSHRGPLPALTGREEALASELRLDVTALAGEIGRRWPKRASAARAVREGRRG